MTALAQLSDVSVRLGGREVLSGVSLDVNPGEFLAVIGPNGAGKTTLLKALAGLLPSGGQIAIESTPLPLLFLADRARKLAYLPQGHTFFWPLPVEEVVGLGRLPRNRGADLSEADREAVRRAIEATQVTEYAARPVTTLSGGERARVALARVLATEAPLILADEPTASLDPRYQIVILDILRRHAAAGGAVIAVLHDLNLASRYADRLLLLDRGKAVATGRAEMLTDEVLAETFGVEVKRVQLGQEQAILPWSAH